MSKVLDNNYKNITIGKGCVLQFDNAIYKYYLEQRNKYINFKKEENDRY